MADQEEPSIQLDEAEILADAPADVKNEKAEESAAAEESSTEEKDETDKGDQAEETAAEGEDEASEESESEEEAAADETTGEEKPVKGADQRKEQLNGEIRDLVSTRNQLRADVERLNGQTYKPQSAQEIMDETGQDEAQARLTAMEQREELRNYNDRVAEAQLTISTESQRVLDDFPMFNPSSDQYVESVAKDAANMLAQNILIDPNTGQIIGSNVSPYQFYKTIANAHSASAVENQVAGQRAAEKQLASADAPASSAAPKEKKEDPFLAGLTQGLAN